MLFDLGEIEMNRPFGPIHGLYSISHKNPAFYGDVSAVSLVFTAKTPTNSKVSVREIDRANPIKKGAEGSVRSVPFISGGLPVRQSSDHGFDLFRGYAVASILPPILAFISILQGQ